jgi:hypothetical protein
VVRGAERAELDTDDKQGEKDPQARHEILLAGVPAPANETRWNFRTQLPPVFEPITAPAATVDFVDVQDVPLDR